MNPIRVRLLAVDDDRDSALRIEKELSKSDLPVICESGPPSNEMPYAIDAVIIVWSSKSETGVKLFQEIAGWQRKARVQIHLFDLGEASVPAFIREEVASTFRQTNDESLADWLDFTVLGRSHRDQPATKIRTTDQAIANVRASIRQRFNQISVVGQQQVQNLDDVFIRLRIEGAQQKDLNLKNHFANDTAEHIFLLGVAGSGKSTVLKHLALEIARDDDLQAMLPIFMSASEIERSGYDALEPFIRLALKGLCLAEGKRTVDKIFEQGQFPAVRSLLIIDGIDELSTNARTSLRRMIGLFETEYPGVRIILSGRPSGWTRADWSSYRLAEIKPLEEDECITYIRKHAGDISKSSLSNLVKNSRSIRELASIPFMLALMVSFAGTEGSLPNERARLIKHCVTALLSRRSGAPLDYLSETDIMSCLAEVGHRLFRLNASGGHREYEYIFGIQNFLSNFPIGLSGERDPAADAKALLDHFVLNTGLIQLSSGNLEFVHRSIWEFFVALRLVEHRTPLRDLARSPIWEEPIRLYSGLLSEPDLKALVEEVWPTNPSLTLRLITESQFDLSSVLSELVRGSDPTELAELVRNLRNRVIQTGNSYNAEVVALETIESLFIATTNAEIIWECVEVLCAVRHHETEACEFLDRLIDFENLYSRREELKRTVEFIRVPGGPFMMGSDDPGRSIDERPAHEVLLSDFNIGDVPLQNFHRVGYPYELGMLDDERSPSPSHPIIGVTWFEAQLAALWFGCRLPTEAEWEFACRARGDDDAALGDEDQIPRFAWFAENSSNTTHPPRQREPNSLGLFDMLGNVREWCSDWFGADYYASENSPFSDPQGPEAGLHKVLRGGCFDWNTKNLVPTYRNSNLPHNRGFQNGVRLVYGLPARLEQLQACGAY